MYEFQAHPVWCEDKTYYCRALNAVLDVKTVFCHCCPLLGGFTQGVQQGNPECYYYDGVDWDDLRPKSMQKRIAREILLGKTEEFPHYAWEERPLDRVLEPALIFAAKAHKGMFRKGTQIPYIAHPMEAAMIAAEITDNPAVIAAAALHDVLEDTPFLPEDIKERFGREVLALVEQETENKREDRPPGETWRTRKEETLHALDHSARDAQIVTLGDKLSNMRQMKRDFDRQGDKMWRKFNMKDKQQHAWYYGNIGHILQDRLGETPAFKEYMDLVKAVFEEEGL